MQHKNRNPTPYIYIVGDGFLRKRAADCRLYKHALTFQNVGADIIRPFTDTNSVICKIIVGGTDCHDRSANWSRNDRGGRQSLRLSNLYVIPRVFTPVGIRSPTSVKEKDI